ncbi:hypothetical protein DFQ28_004100 [Apophysomyces sp. BC1034]|nr:hypothetical protein DFQ29_004080 [Apophysomyces sp. BC1021]KAG0193659.1 hypothetical protein DFQ28_004100 [Apophysomyces sp. BC1034]
MPSPKDDYFDFRSTGAADLLLDPPEQFVQGPARDTTRAYDDMLIHSSSSSVHQDITNSLFFPLMDNFPAADDDWHPIITRPTVQPAKDDRADAMAEPVQKTQSPKKDPFIPPPRTHSISALDRFGLVKPSTLSTSTSVSSLREEQQQPSTLRTQGSSISLGGFWKSNNPPSSSTQRRRIKQPKQGHGLSGLPTLQISTSSLRLRSNSHDSQKSPDSPPHNRPAPAEPHSIAPRRGSLFAGTVPSLVQGALSKDKTHLVPSSCFGATHSKSDADIILATPDVNQAPDPPTSYLSLMERLRKSIKEGGFVTGRLHIPKEFWLQSGIRLPALDAKIETCRLLLIALKPMKARTDFDNASSANTELTALERTLEQIQYSFSKKLGIGRSGDDDGGSTTTSDGSHYRKSSHTIAVWGSKLTKSVERMKLESSKSSDDQYNTYIHTLAELLDLVQVLDHWHTQYIGILDCTSPDKATLHKRSLRKTQACTETLSKIVCGFVMRDFSRLLNKWIKKGSEWVDD